MEEEKKNEIVIRIENRSGRDRTFDIKISMAKASDCSHRDTILGFGDLCVCTHPDRPLEMMDCDRRWWKRFRRFPKNCPLRK
jgi:hypothetical protein